MTLKKIDKMHYLYGKGIGTCKDCNRLKCYVVSDRNRRVYKCLNYGNSNAESTDWRLHYKACGIKNRRVEKEAIRIYVAKENEDKKKEFKNQLTIQDYIALTLQQ